MACWMQGWTVTIDSLHFWFCQSWGRGKCPVCNPDVWLHLEGFDSLRSVQCPVKWEPSKSFLQHMPPPCLLCLLQRTFLVTVMRIYPHPHWGWEPGASPRLWLAWAMPTELWFGSRIWARWLRAGLTASISCTLLLLAWLLVTKEPEAVMLIVDTGRFDGVRVTVVTAERFCTERWLNIHHIHQGVS